jgi:hypothetical protein
LWEHHNLSAEHTGDRPRCAQIWHVGTHAK